MRVSRNSEAAYHALNVASNVIISIMEFLQMIGPDLPNLIYLISGLLGSILLRIAFVFSRASTFSEPLPLRYR